MTKNPVVIGACMGMLVGLVWQVVDWWLDWRKAGRVRRGTSPRNPERVGPPRVGEMIPGNYGLCEACGAAIVALATPSGWTTHCPSCPTAWPFTPSEAQASHHFTIYANSEREAIEELTR